MATLTAARISLPYHAQVALVLATVVIVLDQATKQLVLHVLEPGVFVPWLSDSIGWELVFNPGGAFGLPAPPWLFLLVTGLVVGIVLRALPRTPTLTGATAYGLLLAGALGNVFDRLLRPNVQGVQGLIDGAVIDFVAWGSFPRFNVADSAITVGFVLLVIALLIEERREES